VQGLWVAWDGRVVWSRRGAGCYKPLPHGFLTRTADA